MRLIITDSNLIWHKDNPYLKKYKDVITVVCLDGKKLQMSMSVLYLHMSLLVWEWISME